MSPELHDLYTHRILDRVAEASAVSQRSLARELGIALGLTNLLVRRLASKGWIRVVRVRPNQVRYVLTPEGFAKKARLSRDSFLRNVRFYAEARDRVQQQLNEIVEADGGGACRSVVFLGAGEVAEVGWVCLQRTPLSLVGVVDDVRSGGQFFDHTIHPVSALTDRACNEVPYDRIIVMELAATKKLRVALARAGVDNDRVFWL